MYGWPCGEGWRLSCATVPDEMPYPDILRVIGTAGIDNCSFKDGGVGTWWPGGVRELGLGLRRVGHVTLSWFLTSALLVMLAPLLYAFTDYWLDLFMYKYALARLGVSGPRPE
jgi:hypothetical protein